jgi:hypothetical protein
VDRHDDQTPAGDGREHTSWRLARAAMAQTHADPSLSGLAAGLQRVCRAATSSLGLLGAVVHLITGEREALVASSDEASRRLGELPFEVGEGPCLEAFALARPILVPDLMLMGPPRWPGYLSAVDGHGLRASYSFPLLVGAVRLGVLDLYGASPRSLTPTEVSLALVFARVAIETLLDGSDGSSVALLDDPQVGVMHGRLEIYQAQGMVKVDLGVDLAEALALMRAHAFGRDVTLLDVARLILDGERLLGPQGG